MDTNYGQNVCTICIIAASISSHRDFDSLNETLVHQKCTVRIVCCSSSGVFKKDDFNEGHH